MKNWCNIDLVFLCVFFTVSQANIIYLYEKIHFYEIKTNFDIQPFATFIGGDGVCAKEIDESHISWPFTINENKDQTKLQKEYQLETNILIYSNYEKTLSFLIQVEFNSINLPGPHKIQGYELKFYFDNSNSSCVQIINEQQTGSKRFKFTVKDPSFLSHTNYRYSFYFGKIVVRALTSCDNKNSVGHKNGHLCALGSSQSSVFELGIKSAKYENNLKIVPDLCNGHLMSQTCIIRFNNLLNDEEHYYIILHPMPDEFERVLADVDMFSLDQDQMKKVEEAKKEGKMSVFFENVQYFTNMNSDNLYFAPNLVSKRSQAMANGLVAKLVKSNDRISYISILNKPSKKNTCLNESSNGNNYCRCGDTCNECYQISLTENKQDVINYVPLNYDKDNKTPKSKHCSDHPFNIYDFKNVKMALNFQNQKLSSDRKKISLDESSFVLSNRDFLPRLCIDFKYGEAKGFFRLKILFNDYRMVAESSLLNTTLYRLNLYEYNYADKNIHQKKYNKKFLFKLDVRPVAFIDPINSKQLVEIDDLKFGKYFLELQVKQKSKLCPGVNQCIDESTLNNEIKCVKCNRLLIKFDLQSKMVCDQNSVEPINKYSRINCRGKKPKISVHQMNSEIDFNSFKCPKESTVLTNIITNSNFDLNEIFYKTDTLAGLLPDYFNLSNMVLPFDFSDQMDLIEFCNGIEIGDLIGNRYLFLIISLFLAIIFVFMVIYLFSFQSILNYALTSNKKIVFYLSIFLSKEQQQNLNEFVIKYTELLKKRFKSFSIEIINYSTDCQKRTSALDNADKIVYVCGTKDEIKILQSPFIIGQNKFHDEYNKLHCFPQYEAKTINVTFNQQVEQLNLNTSEGNSEKSSLINSAEPSPKLSSFVDSSTIIKSLSYREALSHKYLKLPEQNRLLISFLLGPDKNCLFSYPDSGNNYFKRIHKISRDVCIKRFDKTSNCLIKNDRSNIFYFEKNNLYEDDKSTDYLEFNDPEFEALIPMHSITNSIQSMSTDSSKTTYDENELTNEVDQMPMEQKPLILNRAFY